MYKGYVMGVVRMIQTLWYRGDRCQGEMNNRTEQSCFCVNYVTVVYSYL